PLDCCLRPCRGTTFHRTVLSGTFLPHSGCDAGRNQRRMQMTRFVLAGALAAAIAGTAYAQATEYYVVQDTTTKKCTIVDKKPTTTTVVQVGPVAFKTRAEAEAGMKTITVCSSN